MLIVIFFLTHESEPNKSIRLLAKLAINFPGCQFSPGLVMIGRDTAGGTEMEHRIKLAADRLLKQPNKAR